ncbi:MAG: hypothetical protein WCC10_03180 [Tumebacillaceae bacterium]
MEFRYLAADKLNDRQAKALVSRLIYSVEGISRCWLDEDTGHIVFEGIEEDAITDLTELLDRMAEKEKKIRHLTSRVLRETPDAPPLSDVPARRLEVEAVFAKDGSVRKGAAVQVMQALQLYFLELAMKYDPHLRYYPTMMKREALEPCSYIQTFPQNLFFVAEFPHQLPVLEQVKETKDPGALTRMTEHVLTPAQCFHSYAELQGQTLSEPMILTSQGTCYRHETPWRVGNQRMNEFVLREILFVGPADFVETTRRALVEDAWQTAVDFGLTARLETALDPFYFSEDAAKGTVQLMGDMKIELVVSVNDGQDQYAVSSMNNMREALCLAYEIHGPDGKPYHSGCTGFGIERWLYALLSTHGADLAEWPASVLAALKLDRAGEGDGHADSRQLHAAK